jgi:F-box/leucine-rich repeat protein 13
MSDCISLTDNSMRFIGTLKQLRVLNVADCLLISDTGIKALTEGTCQYRLRELNLTNCMRISDGSMMNLLRRCKRLAYLKLCYLDQITENGLELIGQMEQLILIDLTGTQISDTSLKTLGNSGHLRSVILSSCRKITDLGLTKFATSCPSLEYLNLSFCTQLSDNAIRSMAFCCKYLTALNICSCSLLTDMSLQYLSGVCKYLYEIDLSYCQLITDKGLKCLGENSHYLKRVIVVECPNISRTAIDHLARKVPYVQFQYTDT